MLTSDRSRENENTRKGPKLLQREGKERDMDRKQISRVHNVQGTAALKLLTKVRK